MRSLATILLLLAFPALVFPAGLSVCVCIDCGCDGGETGPPPCCGGPLPDRSGDDDNDPCARLLLDGTGQSETPPVPVLVDTVPAVSMDRVVPLPEARPGPAPVRSASVTPPRLLPLRI